MHMDMHIVGGRYYQYGVAVWVHHLYGRWRGRFGGGKGLWGGHMAAAQAQAAVPGSRDFATWGV
jgi:hypothetical protein